MPSSGRRAVAHQLGRAEDRAVAAENDRRARCRPPAPSPRVATSPRAGRTAASSRTVIRGEHRAGTCRRSAPTTRWAAITVSGAGRGRRRGCCARRARRRASLAPPPVGSRCSTILSDCSRVAARGARCTRSSRACPAIGEETTPARAEPCIPRRPQHTGHGVRAGWRHPSRAPRGRPVLPTSNCGLTSRTKSASSAATARERRQHLAERDERQVGRRSRRALRARRSPRRAIGRQVAHVDSLDRASRRGSLGDRMPRAGRGRHPPRSRARAPRSQQHLGEAAGRRARCRARAARSTLDAERVERRRSSLCAARLT